MWLPWRMGVALFLGVFLLPSCRHLTNALDIPLEVEQLPAITEQSPASLIAFPFDENFAVKCEATGNPEPEFKWTKNGQVFDPYQDPRLLTEEDSGTFVIPNNGNLTEFQGIYRCYASNKLGTAMSEEIEFIVPNVPKFPKEKIEPLEVEEGQPVVLECSPPKGIPPLQIYWMTIGLRHIEQDERVSVGLNGNLYFSNAVRSDSRHDYCCFAAFPRIRTIVQKTAMSVVVVNTQSARDSGSDRGTANSILERKPSLMSPPGDRTNIHLVKGEELLLECIPEGLPTPKVEWSRVGHGLPERAVVENHGKLLTIEEVQQEDEGKYMCKATNAHGEAVHYFHVTVEEPPKWEVEPKSQLNMIGADVDIRCVASGNPAPTVAWMVNGVPLSEVPAGSRKVYDDRIVIHNAQPDDSAVYQCEASNQHGTILANANIMVMNLPPLILTEDGLRYVTVERKQVDMHCHVFSSPPSTVTWSRVDSAGAIEGPRFSVHVNGTLEISSVEREDEGEYSCFAQNTEGKSAITVTLEVKAPTRIVEPPKDLRILVGTTAQFSCLAEVDPSFSQDYELFWAKDGVALNESETAGYFVDNELLQVVNVSFGHQGVFTCTARSPVDQDTAVARLTVLDVPEAPVDVTLSERKDKTVKLKWIPGDDHNSTTTEFIIEYEENQWEPGRWKELQRVPGNHHSALLKLHGHVDYSFRVSAINEVGKGRPSKASERYRTPASAPDRNPENIKIEGHLPHEMDINWEPLSPIEHNGPGLEYIVSYRRQGIEEDWRKHTVKRHSFVVKNTPTFVPYEVRIHARNHAGWAPEPRTIIGYSGEDFPSAAPDDVAVEVMNGTLVKVSWSPVHKDMLHGRLGGYRVNWWRLRSLLDARKTHGEKHTLTFPGDRTHAHVPGLQPFSEYSLSVLAFTGRGNGPDSHAVSFKTPEGVPDQAVGFRATDIQKHAVMLSWSPPAEPNGVLTGYILQYQLINSTEDVGPLQSVDITATDSSEWLLQDLEPLSRYRFYLRCCTRVGCGPVASEEGTTGPEAPSRDVPVFSIRHPRTRSPPRTSTVSIVANTTLSSIGLASIHGGISNQGWFIGLMCAVALLTLVMLVACFVNRNKGGKYSVKEKEDLHPDVESQGMNDDTFCEYSDNDEKPLRGSQHSLTGDMKGGDSVDSMVDYGDEDAHFNEDGSFIGEYAGRKERSSLEIKGSTQSAA